MAQYSVATEKENDSGDPEEKGTPNYDGKIKAPTWVGRMWLVGLDIFDFQRVRPAIASL